MMLSEKQTARRAWRPPISLIVLVCFIAVPLAEIAVLIKVGGWIGLGPTLALIVLTAIAGAWMLRRQGLAVLRRAQQQMQQGVAPIGEVFEGFCLVIAGALLLTPGFLTDGAGALLLLPPVRAWLYRRMRHRIEEQVLSGAAPRAEPPGHHQPPPDRAPVIDVEFDEVPDEMPEPRGSWGRRR
jgi:UPF0716 protein FxsA